MCLGKSKFAGTSKGHRVQQMARLELSVNALLCEGQGLGSRGLKKLIAATWLFRFESFGGKKQDLFRFVTLAAALGEWLCCKQNSLKLGVGSQENTQYTSNINTLGAAPYNVQVTTSFFAMYLNQKAFSSKAKPKFSYSNEAKSIWPRKYCNKSTVYHTYQTRTDYFSPEAICPARLRTRTVAKQRHQVARKKAVIPNKIKRTCLKDHSHKKFDTCSSGFDSLKWNQQLARVQNI